MISRMEFRPRFYETDMMGIVHHANYLKYMEIGRVEWWRNRGITPEVWTDVYFPVYEVKIQYKRPSTFDELLVVTTTLVDPKPHSLPFHYVITRGNDVLCTGETRIITASREANMRVKRLSPERMAMLTGGELPHMSTALNALSAEQVRA